MTDHVVPANEVLAKRRTHVFIEASRQFEVHFMALPNSARDESAEEAVADLQSTFDDDVDFDNEHEAKLFRDIIALSCGYEAGPSTADRLRHRPRLAGHVAHIARGRYIAGHRQRAPSDDERWLHAYRPRNSVLAAALRTLVWALPS